jgi:hypothetical protein
VRSEYETNEQFPVERFKVPESYSACLYTRFAPSLDGFECNANKKDPGGSVALLFVVYI